MTANLGYPAVNPAIVGYQVMNLFTGGYWNGRRENFVLTAHTALKEMEEVRSKGITGYRMVTVLEGEISEPEFEHLQEDRVIFNLRFDVNAGEIDQTVLILDDGYDEELIAEQLESGHLATTLGHDQTPSYITKVASEHVVALILGQDAEGSYNEFGLGN